MERGENIVAGTKRELISPDQSTAEVLRSENANAGPMIVVIGMIMGMEARRRRPATGRDRAM